MVIMFHCWTWVVLFGIIVCNNTEAFVAAPLSQPPCLVLERRYLPLTLISHRSKNGDETTSTEASTSSSLKKKRRPPRIRRTTKPTQTSSNDEINDENDNRTQKSKHEDADSHNTQGMQFASRSDIDPLTQRALTEILELETMTPIQAETYSAALNGKNILAQSPTGSGKTLAYLIPSLQRILNGDVTWHGRSVAIIVLSPTRELALQIFNQAEALLTFHNTKSSSLFAGGGRSGSSSSSSTSASNAAVACLYGGVKIQRDRRLLSGRNGLPAIVVATPGRLLQHLEETRLEDGRKFCNVVDETQIVVLDETDRLLEAFPQETKRILSYLARADKRQNLLFSATFPHTLRKMLMTGDTGIVKGDIVEISCLEKHDLRSKNNQRISDDHQFDNKNLSNGQQQQQRQLSIDQSYVIIDDIETQYMELLLAVLRREISNEPQDYKIIVFFPTGRLVRFMYQFFTTASSGLLQTNTIWEIHSRMSQSSRSRSSDSFRSAKKGILFSSDVSQRGLDYPDVSLVVQYGAPRSRNDYIHRLGRTGRAGKSGKGLLVLMPFERDARSRRGIELDKEATNWLRHSEYNENNDPNVLAECRKDLESSRWKVRSQHVTLTPNAQSAVTSFLAHYLPRGRRRSGDNRKDNTQLDGKKCLKFANDFASAIGLTDLPELDPRLNDRIEG
jgi:ATP-dependent RNA helicase MSS116, mitochondrial